MLVDGKYVHVDEIEGKTKIVFIDPNGKKQNGFIRDNGNVGNRIGGSEKAIYQCSCNGKNTTYETATPFTFNEENKAIECSECGKTFKVIKLPEDFRKEAEEAAQRKKDNLHLYVAGNDWECLGDMYKLSDRVEYDIWNKIKHLFSYYSRQEFEDGDYEYSGETGWLTGNPGAVEKILLNEGLIKSKNTLKAKQEAREKKEKEAKKLASERYGIREEIDSAFKFAEYVDTSEYHKNGVSVSQLVLEGEKIENPSDKITAYGGGSWWVIEEKKEYIWFVKNNGSDGDDWSYNNIATSGAGAIGHRIEYSKKVEKLIKEYISLF